ncbi:MAG: hypothetical protein AAGI23_08735 [Bacteroidota bacterium]
MIGKVQAGGMIEKYKRRDTKKLIKIIKKGAKEPTSILRRKAKRIGNR